MKKIAIMGSTGSIGTQTLDVVRKNGDIVVTALAAGKNIDLLEKQIREFKPAFVSVADKDKAATLAARVRDTNVKVVSGMEGLTEISRMDGYETLVLSLVGMIGIRPAIEAIKSGKDIALANKETLVTAGHIIMPLAKEKGANILPVDSEHSAIFQCLRGNDRSALKKILLTASGGPFRGMTTRKLQDVTLDDALCHPNWSMGAKVTVDSSTLVNKGLEVMEARWLFDVPVDDIEVVVHPQSVIHSMVEYTDGAVIAQLGVPDMRLPIQYALYYPKRRLPVTKRLDFTKISALTFEKPDTDVFYGLRLAFDAAREGKIMPTVFNAANEVAVQKFISRKIPYLRIPRIIEECMEHFENTPRDPSLDEILDTEARVRSWAEGL